VVVDVVDVVDVIVEAGRRFRDGGRNWWWVCFW